MSQILAVRHLQLQYHHKSDTFAGILHYRIESSPTNTHRRAEYPRSFHNMADYSPLTRRVCYAAHLWSFDGHVRRIPPL
jgi:hypothetical protein